MWNISLFYISQVGKIEQCVQISIKWNLRQNVGLVPAAALCSLKDELSPPPFPLS